MDVQAKNCNTMVSSEIHVPRIPGSNLGNGVEAEVVLVPRHFLLLL